MASSSSEAMDMGTIEQSGQSYTEGMSIDELLAELLRLPHEQRAYLAAELIRSLDDPAEEVDEETWNAAWSAEIERRSAELAEGLVESIPWETVHARLLKKLEQMREGGRSS